MGKKGTTWANKMIKVPEDFWNFVQVGKEDECWPWTKGTNSTGYGAVRWLDGKKYSAHRIAFFLANGGIELSAPRDKTQAMFILHKCDNRLCCNPKHFSLGTYNDNIQDMKNKGRAKAPRGEDSPRAKLTNAQAEEIRVLLSKGRGKREIGRIYGVNESVILRISRGIGYAPKKE